MRKGILFFLILVLTHSVACSQAGLLDHDRVSARMKVKLIGEFMARFNREMIPEDAMILQGSDDSDVKLIALLVENSLIEKRPDDLQKFLYTMVRDSIRLYFSDTNWTAVASCVARYKKKSDTITLNLKTEQIEDGLYKWVITKAEGDMLKLRPQYKSKRYIISPTDNELYFMQLSEITEKKYSDILNYSQKGYTPEQTSVFFSLVASGLLKIDYIETIEYHFHTTHYDFVVEYFSRDSVNSGWLISDFKTNNL